MNELTINYDQAVKIYDVFNKMNIFEGKSCLDAIEQIKPLIDDSTLKDWEIFFAPRSWNINKKKIDLHIRLDGVKKVFIFHHEDKSIYVIFNGVNSNVFIQFIDDTDTVFLAREEE